MGEVGDAAAAGQVTGQQVVGDRGQPVHVGPLVDPAAEGLLRGHVRRGADHVGQPAGVDQRLGDAEVGDHQPLAAQPVAGEQEVLRLDVAVHHALGVEDRQAVAGLADQGDHAVELDAPLLEEVGDGAAVGVRHHEVRRPVGLPDVVDADHVVGVGGPEDARLLQEALADVLALRPVVGQRLHGDVGAQLVVAVEPHRGEPADAEPVDPPEPAEAVGEGHARYCAFTQP